MLKLYDKVKIKSNGVTGIVLDVRTTSGRVFYTVELDKAVDKKTASIYPGVWPQVDCAESELELVEDN